MRQTLIMTRDDAAKSQFKKMESVIFWEATDAELIKQDHNGFWSTFQRPILIFKALFVDEFVRAFGKDRLPPPGSARIVHIEWKIDFDAI